MSIFSKLIGERPPKRNVDPLGKAIGWAKRTYKIGARLPSHVFPPTEETAGYIIPTFYAYGEKALAMEIARWEASRQREDGGFVGADGIPYTFDTAQVIRGFLAVLDDAPEMVKPLMRACDYVERHIDPLGRLGLGHAGRFQEVLE